jgi:hypothetical protein
MHLLLLAALAVDHAAANPTAEALAREKSATEKLRAAGLEVSYGTGKLAGRVVRVNSPSQLLRVIEEGRDARPIPAPKDLAPLLDLPWVSDAEILLSDLDAEAVRNLSGGRRYGVGRLAVSGTKQLPCLVHTVAMVELVRLRPDLKSLALVDATLSKGAIAELSRHPGLQSVQLYRVALDREQAEAFLAPGAFPALLHLGLKDFGEESLDPGTLRKLSSQSYLRQRKARQAGG